MVVYCLDSDLETKKKKTEEKGSLRGNVDSPVDEGDQEGEDLRV